MYLEYCWEQFKYLSKEKTYRACLEFEELLSRACASYKYMQESLGYSDLVKVYFLAYYNCDITLYSEEDNTDWELLSIDEYFLEVEKNKYNDDSELISSEIVKFPVLFFNTVQYNKWEVWAKKVAYLRLTKEKELLFLNIEKLYSRYKEVNTSLNYLLKSEQP